MKRELLLILFLLTGCQIQNQPQTSPVSMNIEEEFLPSQLSELVTPGVSTAVGVEEPITHLILQGNVQGITLNGNRYLRVPIGERTLEAATTYYQNQPGIEAVYPDRTVKALSTPNDTLCSQQWALAAEQAFPVYDRLDSTDPTQKIDCSGVTVGIVDSGVDVYHEDLQYTVVTGKNYITNEGGDTVVTDNTGHGTHVAGIIAARRNNAKGIAGIANCKILPIKALNQNATGSIYDIMSGIKYAADNGARVINLSLAIENTTTIDPPMQDALKYAANKVFNVTLPTGGTTTATGAIVVVAAGNNGTSVACPATDPSVIAVSSVSQFSGPYPGKFWEFLSSFSSRGDQIEVSAPGGRILSTVPSNKYEYLSGTSMAAPQVAGMAALILALHPTWSATEVRAKIRTSVDDLGAPGWDTLYGYGRINLTKAIN